MSTASSRVRQGRILLEMAMRNLVASRVRTLVVGGIVALGVVVVVLGSSLLDSIDVGMTRSIQDSLGGHVQLYNAASRDPLALYGGTMGESVLEPIEDFARLKAAALSVPGVKQVVPMGIDQAMVSMGNVFDVALERLRADVRRRLDQGAPAEDPDYEAHKAHLRRMATLLQQELRQAREIADETSGVYKDRKADFDALEQAVQGGFWDQFDRDPLASLEFLENRVAPLSLDGGFTFIRYVGTDPEAFQKAFPGAQVVEGAAIPPGQRGVLLGKLYAEEWLKLRAARRLDKIKEARELHGRKIAGDEELQRWVKENTGQTRDILLQLDPVRTREAARRLQAALGSRETDAAKLVSALLDTDDGNFDERYRIFYTAAGSPPAALLGEGRRLHHHQGPVAQRLRELGERPGVRLRGVPRARALGAGRDDERHGHPLLARPLRLPDAGAGRRDQEAEGAGGGHDGGPGGRRGGPLR